MMRCRERQARRKGPACRFLQIAPTCPRREKPGWMTPRAGVKTTPATERVFRGSRSQAGAPLFLRSLLSNLMTLAGVLDFRPSADASTPACRSFLTLGRSCPMHLTLSGLDRRPVRAAFFSPGRRRRGPPFFHSLVKHRWIGNALFASAQGAFAATLTATKLKVRRRPCQTRTSQFTFRVTAIRACASTCSTCVSRNREASYSNDNWLFASSTRNRRRP